MMRPEFRQLLLDQRGAAVILWSAFTISVGVYLVIANKVMANPRFAGGLSFAETARLVLWFLAIVDFGYYVYWKKRYLAPAALVDESAKTKILRAVEESQGPLEKQAAAVISTYVTRKITLYAIIEAVAVYGLILAIVGGYFADQYLLSALSLLLLAWEFPTAKSFDDLVKRVETSQ